MILPDINPKFGNMYSRLKYSSEKIFTPSFFNSNKYSLLVVEEDDVFFTSLALFLWIDTGIQSLTNASTSKRYIKLIDSKVFEIPKRDFINIDQLYTDILCLIDLNFNPNLSSNSEIEICLNNLKLIKETAKTFFTAEHWEKNII